MSLDLGKRWMMVVLGVSALLGVASLAPAAAQQTGGAGKGDSKDVIVDLSVLDQLGPAATAPGGGTIVLTPPGVKPAKKPAGKAQAATAAAKERVAAKSPPVAAKASAAPPTPPESASEATPAAPGSEAQASESPTATAPAAASAEGAALPEPPPAPVVASPPPTGSGAAPPPPAGAKSAAPAATPPPLAAKSSAPPTMPSEARGEKAFSLRFDSGAADLTDAARSELGKFAAGLKKSNDQRLQVVAYAAGTDADASQARRLALSRALAVRSYLIEQGIGSARMDVRALGNKVEDGGPADRVDIVFIGNK